jgi:hypothetical protein
MPQKSPEAICHGFEIAGAQAKEPSKMDTGSFPWDHFRFRFSNRFFEPGSKTSGKTASDFQEEWNTAIVRRRYSPQSG